MAVQRKSEKAVVHGYCRTMRVRHVRRGTRGQTHDDDLYIDFIAVYSPRDAERPQDQTLIRFKPAK